MAAEAVRPFQTFRGRQADALRAAGIRNEMAVMALPGEEIRSGLGGLLWLLQDGPVQPLARWLALPPLRHGLTLAYRLVAYNRRVLAPPRAGRVTCACDPDPHPGYELGFLGLVGSVGVAGTALFGAALSRATGLITPPLGGLGLVVGAVVGLSAAWPRLPPARARTRLAHLGLALAAVALPLLPAALLEGHLASGVWLGVAAVSALAGGMWGFGVVRRRLYLARSA